MNDVSDFTDVQKTDFSRLQELFCVTFFIGLSFNEMLPFSGLFWPGGTNQYHSKAQQEKWNTAFKLGRDCWWSAFVLHWEISSRVCESDLTWLFWQDQCNVVCGLVEE